MGWTNRDIDIDLADTAGRICSTQVRPGMSSQVTQCRVTC
jgi:hypothetical protein